MKTFASHIDEHGCLVLPVEAARRLGLAPGARVTVEENEHTLSITNVLAHSQELQAENLYRRSGNQITSRYTQQWKPLIHIPRMDIEGSGPAEAFAALLGSSNQLKLFGSVLDQNVDRYP